MWQLDYPWLLLLLPLPWLAYRYLPAYNEARSAVRVPFFAAMSRAADQHDFGARECLGAIKHDGILAETRLTGMAGKENLLHVEPFRC